MLLVVTSEDGTVSLMTVRTPVAAFILALATTLAALWTLHPRSSSPLLPTFPDSDIVKSSPSAQAGTTVRDEIYQVKEPVATNEKLEQVTQYSHGTQKSRATSGVRAGKAPLSYPSLYRGGTGSKIATVSFWERLAYCETHADWENQGRYAGGLGIYIGTWRQWGGTQFAHHPSAATKSEQILVANRISTQGWLRPDGFFQKPVWFSGWGALDCAGRPELVTLSDPNAYTLEHSKMAQ